MKNSNTTNYELRGELSGSKNEEVYKPASNEIVVFINEVNSFLVIDKNSLATTKLDAVAIQGQAAYEIVMAKDNCINLGAPSYQWMCNSSNPTAWCPKCD